MYCIITIYEFFIHIYVYVLFTRHRWILLYAYIYILIRFSLQVKDCRSNEVKEKKFFFLSFPPFFFDTTL